MVEIRRNPDDSLDQHVWVRIPGRLKTEPVLTYDFPSDTTTIRGIGLDGYAWVAHFKGEQFQNDWTGEPNPPPPPTPVGDPLVWNKRYELQLNNNELIFIADVGPNKAGVTVDIQGLTNETDARFSWTFPDNREFPTVNTGNDWVYGIGTSGGKLSLRSAATGYMQNIADSFIPEGKHILKLKGRGQMVMTVS